MKHCQEEVIVIQFVSYAAIPFKAEIYATQMTIDWGDGTFSHYEEEYHQVIHHYLSEGLQTIRMTGEKISYVDISRLSLTKLVLVHCPALEYLDCSANELCSLDLRNCAVLEELRCNSNNLRELDLSVNSAINLANVSYNMLERLQLIGCRKLKTLYCGNNKLRVLDLSGCPSICELNIGYNNLDSEKINSLFEQLPSQKVAENASINYLENPGMEGCDKKIIQVKNWH